MLDVEGKNSSPFIFHRFTLRIDPFTLGILSTFSHLSTSVLEHFPTYSQLPLQVKLEEAVKGVSKEERI